MIKMLHDRVARRHEHCRMVKTETNVEWTIEYLLYKFTELVDLRHALPRVGFRGVSEAVWNFHIGGYQVCEKWLKDRKGRMLSSDEINHYEKIVVALAETMRLMKEVDEVIEGHGGWPEAFAGRVLKEI